VFEEDDEAFAIWRDKIGVPEARIKWEEMITSGTLLALVVPAQKSITTSTQNGATKTLIQMTPDLSSLQPGVHAQPG